MRKLTLWYLPRNLTLWTSRNRRILTIFSISMMINGRERESRYSFEKTNSNIKTDKMNFIIILFWHPIH